MSWLRRLSSHQPPAWLVLFVALFVALMAAVGVLTLLQGTERAHKAQILFLRIDELSKDLHALNLQALVQQELTPDLVAEVDEENRQMEEALVELENMASAEQVLQSVQNVHMALEVYRTSVKEEFQLLEEGKIEEAQTLDAEQVASNFDELDEALGEASIEYATWEEQMDEAANVGILVVLGSAGLLLGLLYWQFERVRRRANLETQRVLRQSEERFRSLVLNGADLIVVLDSDGKILYVSPSCERVLGYAPEELLGTNVFALLHLDDEATVRSLHTMLLSDGSSKPMLEWRVRHRDGSVRHLETIYTNLLGDPRVGGIVVNGRDITERKAVEEQLQHQAFHDPLTGLPNRTLFIDRLEHALRRSVRQQDTVAVLFLDLDRFKVVNDSLGHEIGDELLVMLGKRLERCIRQQDTIARLGGDEFTILLEDLDDPGETTRIAERIVEELRTPINLNGQEIIVTASIGISLGTARRDRGAELMRRADVAMYRAKRTERTHYEVFEPSIDAAAMKRLKLENDLRRAFEEGELQVHYQPKIELATSRIEGFEALVWWAHPARGLISPARFIPLAEEMGLILPLGLWVLREACRQAKIWDELYPDLPQLMMSVNLSARQFKDPNLVAQVSKVIRETNLDPHRLQLEITESVVMGNAEDTLVTLRRLKELGLQLAIDDFGKGYSSLSYLKRFPVDTLKIDRTFIGELGSDPDDTAIVEAVITLAHSLGLRVTAEGLETAEQMAHLRAVGCDFGQGFYFAKPMLSETVAAFLAKGKEIDYSS